MADSIRLTADHAGRFMRGRSGGRVGPLEYDSEGFGFPGQKQWRAPLNGVRAYYWPDGRVFPDEDSSDDLVAEVGFS
jgi:hypothetical protein